MSHFRINSARFATSFALNGALIFAVLYILGILTRSLLVSRDLVSSRPIGGEVAITALLFVGCLLSTRRTWVGDRTDLRREIVVVFGICAFFGLSAALVCWTFFGASGRLCAFLLLEGTLAVPLAVMAWRWISIRWNVFDGTRERVLLVGTGETARQLCRWIALHHSRDFTVVGFATEDPCRIGEVLSMGSRILTDYDSLRRLGLKHADRVIVALEEKRGKLPLESLIQLRLNGVAIEEITSFIERISGKIAVESLLPSWLIYSDGFKTSRTRAAIKRTMDILLSIVLLVMMAPLMLLTALIIRLESSGPILFRQKRMGRGGVEFNLLKFRSMIDNAEADGPAWASENDPRITRFGKLMRKFRIDELPQLANVLRGHMSFVGPRPERRHFVRELENKIPYFGIRMSVRPGITGWAQVRHHYGASADDALEKLKYDLYYIKNGDALFDLWIVMKTVWVVLQGQGAR